MYSSTHNNSIFRQDVFKLANFFSYRLDSFLAPFLVELDELLDKRLLVLFQDYAKVSSGYAAGLQVYC